MYGHYEVLSLNIPAGQATTAQFIRSKPDRITVKNTGAKPVLLQFQQPTNDWLTFAAGETRDIPLKARTVAAKCANGTDTGTVEIIGFSY